MGWWNSGVFDRGTKVYSIDKQGGNEDPFHDSVSLQELRKPTTSGD
jgi:hypothetical protein